MDCSLRFRLRYLERLSYPAMESEPALENEQHQQEGEYFHRIVQQYLIGIPKEQISKLANSANLQRWWGNFLSDPLLQDLQGKVGLFTESNLSAPLGKHRLVAKYDLITVQDGKATIYDWKTYRKRPRTSGWQPAHRRASTGPCWSRPEHISTRGRRSHPGRWR